MNKRNTFSELILPLAITIIPSILSYIGYRLYSDVKDLKIDVLVCFVAYIFSAIIVCALCFFIERIFVRRIYKKYEGIWIQYIPDFTRKIAVCELKYTNGSYHFSGINYGDSSTDYTLFESEMFIENGPCSFYYITSAHEQFKPEEIQGFGKVYNITKQNNNVYECQGFFFDVVNADRQTQEKALQRTYLFKFDENFITYFRNNTIFVVQKRKTKIKKTHSEIYNEYGGLVKRYCEMNLMRRRNPFGSA